MPERMTLDELKSMSTIQSGGIENEAEDEIDGDEE